MLSREENQLLTQIGPDSPCGNLLRRYWQPAALSEEVPSGGAPIAVRILDEDLVLFRDEEGRPGLLGLHCSHRGADLSYGRVEDGGIRCIYHGWLYNIHGECLDQPGEPGGGEHRSSIRHLAYPCQEVGGLIFCYLGPGEAPLLPAYEIFTVSEEFSYKPTKTYHECSYLQANEGNLDPGHLSFLHRLGSHVNPGEGRAGSGAISRSKAQELNRHDTSPKIDVEITDFGLRIYTIRSAVGDQNYIRITNFVMPNLCAIGGGTSGDGFQIDWHVPIDDTHHWKYTLAFRRSAPLTDRQMKSRLDALTTGYKRIRNASNRYLQNREEMQTETFTGLGTNFSDHDGWAVESQGPIQDLTKEYLGYTDKAIIVERKLILKAIQDVKEGRDPMHVVRKPSENHFTHLFVRHELVPTSQDWKDYWKASVLKQSETKKPSTRK